MAEAVKKGLQDTSGTENPRPDEDEQEAGPGTQPADVQTGAAAWSRPVGTQALFRPNFDDDDEDDITLGTDRKSVV